MCRDGDNTAKSRWRADEKLRIWLVEADSPTKIINCPKRDKKRQDLQKSGGCCVARSAATTAWSLSLDEKKNRALLSLQCWSRFLPRSGPPMGFERWVGNTWKQNRKRCYWLDKENNERKLNSNHKPTDKPGTYRPRTNLLTRAVLDVTREVWRKVLAECQSVAQFNMSSSRLQL